MPSNTATTTKLGEMGETVARMRPTEYGNHTGKHPHTVSAHTFQSIASSVLTLAL